MATPPSKSDQLADAVNARVAIVKSGRAAYPVVIGGQIQNLGLAELDALISRLEGEVQLEALSGVGGPSRIEIGLGGIQRAL
jgi:hypothetical protein